MTILTNSSVQSWNANTTIIPASEVVPNALALDSRVCTRVPAPQGDASSVRVPFIPTDPTAEIVAEGAEIPVGDVTRAEIAVYSRKIGLIQVISNEAYSRTIDADNGSASVPDLLTDSLRRAVTAKADAMMLTAPARADDPYAPGLTVDTTQAVVDGGNITTTLDPLVDALAAISDNGAQPTAILTSNSGWARLQKMRYTDGRPVVNPDAQTDATPLLAGLPVIRNAAMPRDLLLIVDASNILTTFNDVNVTVDTSSRFDTDSTAIRVTGRIGWAVIQRGRIARLTINRTDTDTTNTNGKTKITVGA